jgi:hypothetical protein
MRNKRHAKTYATHQTVKRNKDGCAQLMEDIHRIIYAIIDLHMRSEPWGELSPEVLHYIGKFTE